ncbi:sugar ABC transporter substrate-binding protein [Clostridium formicaceticum]|nr:sugar ABC transporter substrate-binding protein [Clostridium formicaceticum]ARE86998.1 D-allose-binding periplasmic protein precursor [Clostridium formicaceticum]
MKKVGIYMILLLIAIIFSSCSKAPDENVEGFVIEDHTKEEGDKDALESAKTTIGLVMKTLTNPFFIDMELGARKAEEELGIRLLVRTGAQETSIQQQIAIVEELIKLRVDAIVIAPGHSTELIPVLKKAQDAKIAIVNIDNKLDFQISKEMGLINVPFISIDNQQGGYEAAKYIADQVTKPTKAIILEGILGAKNSEERKKGALKAFEENKNIDLVAIETANWKIDEAFSVISQIFKEHPDIGIIFCANDMMALGVIEYLVKENKENVLIAGFDALEEAKKAIRKGAMKVTIDQQADLQGYTGVMYAVKMIEGKGVPEKTLIPIKVVDIESLR